MPSFSNCARTKRSMGVLDHFVSLTAGSGGFFRGRKDQKLRRSGEMTYLPSLLEVTADAVLAGQAAPALTQASKSAISAGFNLPPYGIFNAGSVWRMALIKRLFSASPGTIAGPRLPPFFMPSNVSRRKPPSCELVWQPKQLLARIGRTLFSKNSGVPAFTV